MEESEKRKERLRAMRAGAPQSEPLDVPFDSAAPMHLLNPLIQPSAAPSGAERSPTSRFDYYTDPMSAYSGNKKRSDLAHRPPGGFSSPVSGHSPMAHLPSPSSGQGRGYMTQTPIPANLYQGSYSPHQGSYVTPSPIPQYEFWRSPVGRSGPFSGNYSARFCSSTSASGLPHGSLRGTSISPGFGGASASTDSGRGSLSSNSGRGSGQRAGNYQSPCSGRGGRGGRGSKDFVSAREYPGLFFRKLMVLDPWDNLEPVVGRILEPRPKQIPPDSLKSWLPESIRTKRAKVVETASVSSSQGSLAEYIAMAFEEAANDDETT